MATRTFTALAEENGSITAISFYKETPGGWKLDFKDDQGRHIVNGDRWIETLDDLVLQVVNFTKTELIWRSEDKDVVTFYSAVQECILGSLTD